jgi:23S rRNA (guanosine2251-2'-O)-methyltransferase
MKLSLTAVLEDIRSALNVGAIFRTSETSAIKKLVLCGITAYPPHNKIPKTALGAENLVDWEYYADISELINQNTKPLIAVEVTPKAKIYTDFNFPKNAVVVFGNEITGVSNKVLNKADEVVKIPMFGKKESLNVATTFGIIIYEIIRQHAKNNIW